MSVVGASVLPTTCAPTTPFAIQEIAICRSAPTARIQTPPAAPLTSPKHREEARMTPCQFCHDKPATDGHGLCGNCHWAVQAETRAAYEAWCDAHGVAA